MLKVLCEARANNTQIEMKGSFTDVYAELCMVVLHCIDGLAQESKQGDVTVEEAKSVLIDEFTDMLKALSN